MRDYGKSKFAESAVGMGSSSRFEARNLAAKNQLVSFFGNIQNGVQNAAYMETDSIGRRSSDGLDEEIIARINEEGKKRPSNTKINDVNGFPSNQQDAPNNTPASNSLPGNIVSTHPVKARDSRKQ